MKTYRFLSVVDHQLISSKLYEYVVNKTDILEKTKIAGSWNYLEVDPVLELIPELKTALSNIIDHEVTMIAVLSFPVNTNIPIHIDHGNFKHRVLWPVLNCAGSKTRFYHPNGNKLVKVFSNKTTSIVPEDRYPLREVDSCELVEPMVINTRALHGVTANPTATGHRLSATFGFGSADLGALFDNKD